MTLGLVSISYYKNGWALENTGHLQDAHKSYLQAVDACQKIVAAQPEDVITQHRLALACDKVASTHLEMGQPEKSLAAAEQANTILQRLDNVDAPNSKVRLSLSWSYAALGDAHMRLGHMDKGITAYDKAITTFGQLVELDPGDLEAKRSLAITLFRQGDAHLFLMGDAQSAWGFYLESNEICQSLADPNHVRSQSDLGHSFQKLGDVCLMYTGKLLEALKYYERTVDINRKLAAQSPTNAVVQQNLSTALERLGMTSERLGQFDVARNRYHEMLSIKKSLAEADPTNAVAQRELATTYIHLGDVCLQAKQRQEALKFFQLGFDLDEQRAEESPQDASAQRDLLQSCGRMGDLHLQLGNLQEGTACHRRALKIAEQLASAAPADSQAQRDLFLAHNHMATAYLKAGQQQQALEIYLKCKNICQSRADSRPADHQAQRDLSIAYSKLGDVIRQIGEFGNALEHYERSLTIRETLAKANPTDFRTQHDLVVVHQDLAELYQAMGDFDASAEQYESAARVLRHMISQGMNVEQSESELAIMLDAGKRVSLAIVALGDWTALLEQPSDALPMLLDIRATLLVRQGHYDDAAKAATKLLDMDTVDMNQLYNVGCVLSLCAASIEIPPAVESTSAQARKRQDWIDNAVAALHRAIDAGWKDFDHMLQDPDLAVLQDVPAFKELIPRSR